MRTLSFKCMFLIVTFAAGASIQASVTITTVGLPAGTLGDSYPTTQLAASGAAGDVTSLATLVIESLLSSGGHE